MLSGSLLPGSFLEFWVFLNWVFLKYERSAGPFKLGLSYIWVLLISISTVVGADLGEEECRAPGDRVWRVARFDLCWRANEWHRWLCT